MESKQLEKKEKLKRQVGLLILLAFLTVVSLIVKQIYELFQEEKKQVVNLYIVEAFPYTTYHEYKVVNGDTIPHGKAFCKHHDKLKFTGNYIDGKKHGAFSIYNDQGFITSMLNYSNDLLNDTAKFFSAPDELSSYKIFRNDTLLRVVHLDEDKQPFITFLYDENNQILNLTKRYTESTKHKDFLTLSSDSTYTLQIEGKTRSGKFSFALPYYLKLDSTQYFITYLSESRIILQDFSGNAKDGLPDKFDGYNTENLSTNE